MAPSSNPSSPRAPRRPSTMASLGAVLLLGGLTGVSASCVLVVDDTECGPNAYEYRGACFCEDGFEGDPGFDEGCDPIMTVRITDDCDDSADIGWKLFSDDRDWTWPSGTAVYVTPGLGLDGYETITCKDGEQICFGAESESGLTWGVGTDFSQGCEDCCFICGPYEHDLGFLTCG